jgi:AcrR family transcriptional regulator
VTKIKHYRVHLSTATDARAVRTRETLRQSLLTLIESKPIDQITIREIAATAGIGYTTFFRHYPTKEELLSDLAAEEIRSLISLTVPVMDADRARAASEALFAYVSERRRIWSAFLTGGAAGMLREELLRVALKLAAERTQPAAWPLTELATRLIVLGTMEMLGWWLRQPNPMPIPQAGDLHLRTVVLPPINLRQASR